VSEENWGDDFEKRNSRGDGKEGRAMLANEVGTISPLPSFPSLSWMQSTRDAISIATAAAHSGALERISGKAEDSSRARDAEKAIPEAKGATFGESGGIEG